MATEFTVTIRATSIQVYPGQEAIPPLQPLLNLLTYEDEYVEQTKTLGFMLDTETDILYLHKGVDPEYLRRLLVHVKFIMEPCDPCREMKFDYEEIIPPRDNEQVDAINFIAGIREHLSNAKDSQVFLVKGTGKGKALPYSTKIPTPTPEGYTLMRDLKVGDKVFNRFGQPVTVLETFEQGVRDVYKVTFNDGRYSYCDKNHLWNVRTLTMNTFEYKTMKLADIIKDYKVYKTTKIFTKAHNITREPCYYRYRIQSCEPVNYPERDLPINPWIIGCLIGNGCLRERVLSISSGNDYVPFKIAELCNFDVKRNSLYNYTYSFYNKETKTPIKTVDFLKDIPQLIDKYSYQKSIPNEYMINSVENRLMLLRGLLDTDGSINKCGNRYHVTFSSTSETLLEQIQQLAYSLGYSGTIVKDKRICKYTSGYCGAFLFKMPHIDKRFLFTLPYKLECANEAYHMYEKLPNKTDKRELIIKDIHLSHQENCKCIMVDDPEGLYLTENYIVTHNTYCSDVGMCLYHKKTLVIMHRDTLRTQWVDSIHKMTGMTSRDVFEITSGEELCKIANNEHDYDFDVYLMTHATFRAGLKRVGSISKMSNVIKNLGIGLKIIDEAHLEFRDTLMMDFCFNVQRNLYLTATDGRSSKDENSIFKHVFANTTFYKPSSLLTADDTKPSKWVEYNIVEINTHVNPKLYRFKIAGGKGMSVASYGKWVIQHDRKQTHFKVIRDLLRQMFENDPQSKVLVFLPLIDLCTECAYFLSKYFDHDDTFEYSLNIRTINSKNSTIENERAQRADIIVTTIASCGVGKDIKGLTGVISCSPFCSSLTATQVLGRLRYCGKTCYYYDIFDTSVQMDRFWLKARSKTLKRLAMKTNYLSWTEEEPDEKA